MKTLRKTTTMAAMVAGMLVPFVAANAQAQASAPGSASQGLRDREIYGYQLMTPAERSAFRERMRQAKTPEDRERLRAEHHEQMKARAKERGITLPDMPPPGGRGPRTGRGPGG